MSNQATLFNGLKTKLTSLIQEYKLKEEELSILRKENKELHSLLGQQGEQIKSFQNQEKISKIVSSVNVEGEKTTDLKLKINEYIKEIDKCIAHLSE